MAAKVCVFDNAISSRVVLHRPQADPSNCFGRDVPSAGHSTALEARGQYLMAPILAASTPAGGTSPAG
jgi:hypothetical protein